MKIAFQVLLGIFALLLVVRPAQAANRDVCSTCTYTNIRDAIDAAVSGDTIRVAAGTYTTPWNDFGLNSGTATFVMEGGYNSTFTARNGESILTGVGIQFGPSFNGAIVFDGFSITNAPSSAIYFASGGAQLTVRNCHFYNNAGPAIMVWPYTGFSGAQNIVLTNNVIEASVSGGIYIFFSNTDPYTVNMTITDNVISGTTGFHGAGIEIVDGASSGALSISGNELFDNIYGAYVQFTGSGSTLDIFNNSIHHNSENGLHLWGSAANADAVNVHHNVIYNNTRLGVYHRNQHSAVYSNNTIANNDVGVQFISADGSPTIVNNIFYNHAGRSLMFSSDDVGWGSTNIVPTKMRYNDFFNPGRPITILHTGMAPSYSFHEELGDNWTNYNQFAWSGMNFTEDPRLTDPDNADFRLRSDSFCIDEGDPTVAASNEPAANGSRINLGVYGDSSVAETSPTAVVASGLSAAQSGNDLVLSFQTTSSVQTTWLKAEYWNGSSFQNIPAEQLSGTGYALGYQFARYPTGLNRSLTWTDAHSTFGDIESSNLKVRVTAFHGNTSSSVESSAFVVDYVPPTVQLTAPLDGSYVGASGATLTANAADAGSGIAGVQFRYKQQGAGGYINLNTDTAAPFVGNFSALNLTPGGTYVLQAVATDAKGLSTPSSEVTVNVCSYSLASASASYSADASSGTFGLSVPSGDCSWDAVSNASWLTVTSPTSGGGAAAFSYSVAANTTTTARTGTISVAGKTFTVQQGGLACTYSFTLDNTSYNYTAGNGSVHIFASAPSCAWTLSKNADWIDFTSSNSGSGNGAVSFAVNANTSQTARSALLSLGSQQNVVSQLAAPPPLLVNSASSVSLTAKRKSASITIRNSSSQMLRITGIQMTGSSVFRRGSMRFPVKVKPRKTAKLSISFKTKLRGQFMGTVTVFTDDPNRPSFEIALTALK